MNGIPNKLCRIIKRKWKLKQVNNFHNRESMEDKFLLRQKEGNKCGGVKFTVLVVLSRCASWQLWSNNDRVANIRQDLFLFSFVRIFVVLS